MTILILEDNEERLEAFRAAVATISAKIVIWRNAHRMVKEIEPYLASATIISLDHDLNDDAGEDAGCGMDIVRELIKHKPTCPVFLHTSNTKASWSMLNELRDGGWEVRRIPPVAMGTQWVQDDWLPAINCMKGENGCRT